MNLNNVSPKDYIHNGLFSREHSKDFKESMRDLQRLSPDGRIKPEAYAGRKMLGLTALYSVKDWQKMSAGDSKSALKVAF